MGRRSFKKKMSNSEREMTEEDWVEVGKAFAKVAGAITTSPIVPVNDERRLPLLLYQGL